MVGCPGSLHVWGASFILFLSSSISSRVLEKWFLVCQDTIIAITTVITSIMNKRFLARHLEFSWLLSGVTTQQKQVLNATQSTKPLHGV